jgi:CBS domain-containing protein
MNVQDLMTSVVVTVRPETPLKEVATILAQCGISGVPVVDEDDRVVGVVSEGDVLFKELGRSEQKGMFASLRQAQRTGSSPKVEAQTAAQAMTAPARTIEPWRSASVAAARMLEDGVHRLPVVDDESRLVGIVTRADLVRAFVRSDAQIKREIREDVLERALLLETPAAVTVEVDQGRVSLGGTLRRRTDAELLLAFVARVPGVVEVESAIGWQEDDLKLRPPHVLLGTLEQ